MNQTVRGIVSFMTLIVLTVLCASVVIMGMRISDRISELRRPVQTTGQTVVYIKDGQGSQGVPFYDSVPVPNSVSVNPTLLPNFTRVEMVCYGDDTAGTRWFRVRPEPGVIPDTRPQTVFVPSESTHNQTKVDEC